MKTPKTGTIVILNGTSSSGKTSIIKALQRIQPDPYLEAGLDRFLPMLPARYHQFPLRNKVLGMAVAAGPIGHQLVSGMHRAILALAKEGNNIIADHVFLESRWVSECAQLYSDLPAYLVGVHCPLELAEEREKERDDRAEGQARAQFDIVHAHNFYDLEVDTSVSSPRECAEAIKQRLQDKTPPSALKRLNQ